MQRKGGGSSLSTMTVLIILIVNLNLVFTSLASHRLRMRHEDNGDTLISQPNFNVSSNGTKELEKNGGNENKTDEKLSAFFQSCLPSAAELSNITCHFNSSVLFLQDFEGECVKPGIIRIVGEFDVLTLRCFAPFHLDFDFDGFQPTEAIKVTSWKEIEITNSSLEKVVVAYHIVLKIWSNNALYKFHVDEYSNRTKSLNPNPGAEAHSGKNLDQVHPTQNSSQFEDSEAYSIGPEKRDTFPQKRLYPRTGNYIVRGMTNIDQKLPLYFFFEESSVEKSLMFNNFTKSVVLPNDQGLDTSGNFSEMIILVPCRPSHFNASVDIYLRQNSTVAQRIEMTAYEPWTGFQFPVKALGNSATNFDTMLFECIVEGIVESSVTFTFPPDAGPGFGFDGIPPQTSRDSKVTMNHEVNTITDDPITVNITCVIQTEAGNSFLGSVGCDNPTHMRLVREFVLPGYGKNSYTTSQTTDLVGDYYPYELKIYRAFQTGVSYCVSGKYSRIYEYAAGLNGKIYQLDFGTDYTLLPHTSPRKEVHIHISLARPTADEIKQRSSNSFGKIMDNNTVKLIIGQQYTFKCRIDLFTVAKTIVWDVLFKNGTLKTVKIDYDFPGAFSHYSIVASYELSRVSCSSPFWNNNKWRTDDIDTIVGVEESDSENSQDRIFIVGIAAALVLIILISFGLYMVRKIRDNQQEFSKMEIVEFERGNALLKAEVGFNHLPYDKRYEVTDFTIDYERLLGSGEFGQVFQGLINSHLTVAAKTVKPNSEKIYVKSLLSELKIMIYLGRHENILAILGASTANLRQGSVFIFLEFCPGGSLEKFLKTHRYQLQGQPECIYTQIAIADDIQLTNHNQTQSEETVTIRDLYVWALQISSGMDFISNKGVIHGDLATRNILLGENRQAKICDFGLSRRLHNYKIYAKNNNAQPLPWPWLAPESLTDLTFSTLTDVWSFGITLWEIFTCADTPYPGMNCTLDFVNKLRGGLRNLKPVLATDELYSLMKETWRTDPEDRPTFNEICFTLENLVAALPPDQTPEPQSRRQSIPSDSGVVSSTSSCKVVSNYLPHNLNFTMAC